MQWSDLAESAHPNEATIIGKGTRRHVPPHFLGQGGAVQGAPTLGFLRWNKK